MRRLLSLALLVATLGAAGVLAAWGAHREGGEAGAFHVAAIGPDGREVLNAKVHVADATVLAVLQAAAEARGVELELVTYPGMGTYVHSIAGHRAEGSTGWIYEVQREGAWRTGDRSAEHYPLQKGDATRWSWTEG